MCLSANCDLYDIHIFYHVSFYVVLFFTVLLLIYDDLNISYILRSCIVYDFKYAAMQQPA